MKIRQWLGWSVALVLATCSPAATFPGRWIPANQAEVVRRTGNWQWTSHRYAAESALVTHEDGAALELTFEGRTLVMALDTLTPPNYGPPELGRLDVSIDGGAPRTIWPRAEANEVVLFRSADRASHRVRIVHRADATGAGARIRGFRTIDEPCGDVAFVVSAQQQGGLIDVRAIVRRQGEVIRDALVRNWLTGECRLAALPPGTGYELALRAAGWQAAPIAPFDIVAGRETRLPPIYLERPLDVHVDDVKFPALGRPIVVLPGTSFRTRFEAYRAKIQGVRLVRREGPATISRTCRFEEDKAAAFYYHREGTVTLPDDMPVGVYDLEVSIETGRGSRQVHSRRCVSVVSRYSKDPVFVGFGHLDTWGQFQAEYLERMVQLANLIAPDMVLVSNAANAAYESGALYGLDVPFVITFGNHRSPEPAAWFGEPVGIVDLGPGVSVLNFGRAWDSGYADADALLTARADVPVKIINAFESNAPVREFLDRHRIALIHYAHGPGPAIASLGTTPTVRVGKVNAASFRVIRFKDSRPTGYTYRGHPTAPYPFPRNGPAPLRLSYDGPNDGTAARLTARVTDDLDEPFPQARITAVLARGTYRVTGATLESSTSSDDGRFTVLTARVDVLARATATVEIAH